MSHNTGMQNHLLQQQQQQQHQGLPSGRLGSRPPYLSKGKSPSMGSLIPNASSLFAFPGMQSGGRSYSHSAAFVQIPGPATSSSAGPTMTSIFRGRPDARLDMHQEKGRPRAESTSSNGTAHSFADSDSGPSSPVSSTTPIFNYFSTPHPLQPTSSLSRYLGPIASSPSSFAREESTSLSPTSLSLPPSHAFPPLPALPHQRSLPTLGTKKLQNSASSQVFGQQQQQQQGVRFHEEVMVEHTYSKKEYDRRPSIPEVLTERDVINHLLFRSSLPLSGGTNNTNILNPPNNCSLSTPKSVGHRPTTLDDTHVPVRLPSEIVSPISLISHTSLFHPPIPTSCPLSPSLDGSSNNPLSPVLVSSRTHLTSSHQQHDHHHLVLPPPMATITSHPLSPSLQASRTIPPSQHQQQPTPVGTAKEAVQDTFLNASYTVPITTQVEIDPKAVCKLVRAASVCARDSVGGVTASDLNFLYRGHRDREVVLFVPWW
ncbi:hypothetical protein HDU97_004796 [Phlyctochytrium planicorne]|nr:hypothetical protein HDU97_004796 [Phlyctochytrium planicorne]